MLSKEMLDQALQVMTAMGIGSMSSGVKYVFQTLKGENFKLGTFFGYLFVGGFVGFICDQFLPPERGFRGAIIGLTAFLSFQVLEFVEKNGLRILIDKIFDRHMGTKTPINPPEESKKSEEI